MVNLRPYQETAVETVFKDWKKHDRLLLVQATGTGKTIVFAEITKRIVDNGGRVLVLAHRDELIKQACDKLEWTQGIVPGIEKGTEHAKDESVVVASVQTLGVNRNNFSRLRKFAPDYFTHIIIDEAHHAASDSFLNVLNYFEDAKCLGVTATPYRSDEKDLEDIFDKFSYEYTITEAVCDGFLSPIHVKQIPLEIDINQVEQSIKGDFKESQLSNAIEPYLDEIAKVMKTECAGRKTVVFLPLISTSKYFLKILEKHGIPAKEVNGETLCKDEILKEFRDGEFNTLCNVVLLTEGWDCPEVDCIVILRPTRSRTLYTQMVGRGTRISPGKDNLLLLDFLWLSDEYDVCKPSFLIAEDEKDEKYIDEKINSGEEIDLEEAEKEARTVREQRERNLAKAIERNKYKNETEKDLIEVSLSYKALDDYRPERLKDTRPVSPEQIRRLEEEGIENARELPNYGYAYKLLGTIWNRREAGLISIRQGRKLEEFHYDVDEQWTSKEASFLIGQIQDNHWKLPRGINPKEYIPEYRRETC